MIPKFSIFVSSSDNYSDLWPIFFELFHRLWPDYKGKIYLQTQEKRFVYPGLNIECTQVGKYKYFGTTLLAGLEKVKEEHILFFMIDYLFMGGVNHKKVMEYYEHFVSANLDSLVLCHHNWINTQKSLHHDFQRFLPPSNKILFSYQIAFWKKNVFMSVILPHENPWLSEWFGDARCEKMGLWIESLKKGIQKPIPYDLRGCVHQGRWLDNAIDFLNEQHISVDYSKRGLYSDYEVYKSIRFRLKLKYWIYKCGMMGSYMDLWKRKPIHK